MTPFVDWLLSANVTGTVTWLGTVGSLIGISLTWLQSRAAKLEARKASVQATLAVRAVRAYESRLTIANLAHSGAILNALRLSFQSGEFHVAFAYMHGLKRDLEQIMSAQQGAATATVRRAINTLAVQIGHGRNGHSSFNVGKFDKAANGLMDYLVLAEKRMVTAVDRKGENDAIA